MEHRENAGQYWNVQAALKNFGKRILPQQKAAFVATFLTGLLVHMTGIWGWIFNWDSSIGGRRDGFSWLLEQGKWSTDIVSKIIGQYDTPFRGLIALLVLGAAAMLLVDLFGLKSRLWAALTGVVLAVFPATMSITAYRVYNYYWVMFMAVAAAWLSVKVRGWKGWLAGTALLTFALGTYPPYIGFTAATLLIVLIRELLYGDERGMVYVQHALAALFQLLVSILAYYGILQICLRLTGTNLSSYMNADLMGKVDWTTMPGIVIRAYREVFRFFWYDANGTGYGEIVILYRVMLVLLLVGAVWLAIRKKLWKTPAKGLAILGFMLIYPLAFDLAFILDQGAGTHWMMKYTFVMLPVMVIVIANEIGSVSTKTDPNTGRNGVRWRGLYQWAACLLVFLLAYNWGMLCNEGYTRMRYSYEKAYATLSRIVDDVLESEEYEADKPVAFLGKTEFGSLDAYSQYDNYNGVAGAQFLFAYDGVFERFVEMVLGIRFPEVTQEEKEHLQNTDAYRKMPTYPQKGYVQEIGGVLVVRIG